MCANEKTGGWGLLHNFRMQAASQEDQVIIRELELPALPSLQEMEKSWSLNSITSGHWFHQSCLCKETSIKNSKWQGLRASWLINTGSIGRVTYLERTWKFHIHTSPHTLPCISSIWLSLSYILYNVPVNVCKVISRILWVILVNYQKWREGRGNPQFIVNQLVDGCPHAGIYNWSLKWGQSCETEPLNREELGVGVRIELNCWTPSWCLENHIPPTCKRPSNQKFNSTWRDISPSWEKNVISVQFLFLHNWLGSVLPSCQFLSALWERLDYRQKERRQYDHEGKDYGDAATNQGEPEAQETGWGKKQILP